MAFSYDSEFAAAVAAVGPIELAQAAPGDWRALREGGDAGLALMMATIPPAPDVLTKDFEIEGYEGSPIAVRYYYKAGAATAGTQPGSAVLYIHGGGMVLGSMEIYSPAVASYVDASGVPMLSVDYRLAPEHPHPVPVEDCFAALTWLHGRAAELGIDPARIAVMGDSAGGGLAAGTALLARDRGVSLAKQILIYPMLDDRNVVPDSELVEFVTWTYDGNMTGWGALLGDRRGADDVPPAAAPAREIDYHGLPPAYVEVGELDIFRDEDIEYAQQLSRAGVSTELHVHPGLPHGFEVLGAATAVGERSRADRIRVLTSI
jgi:acetyl esterase/lipase